MKVIVPIIGEEILTKDAGFGLLYCRRDDIGFLSFDRTWYEEEFVFVNLGKWSGDSYTFQKKTSIHKLEKGTVIEL